MIVRLKTVFTAVSLALLIAGTPASASPGFFKCLVSSFGERAKDSSQSILPKEGRLAKSGAAFKFKEVFSRFMTSPEMLYRDPHLATLPPGREFHASNEFDWFKTPQDFQKTDTLIGFGTNSAWDLAIRKNADHLVIGDWHVGPLMTQEYLLKPLIQLAHSPQEFISLLAGVPVPESIKAQDLSATFQYIDLYFRTHPGGDSQRASFLRETLTRMNDNKKITDDQLKGVASYYIDLMKTHDKGPLDTFGPMVGGFVAMVHPGIAAGRGPLFDMFKRRYDPSDLIRGGASPAEVRGRYFSALSSPQAFQRLKHLFDGNIQYAHTGFDDPAFYAAAQKQLGPKSTNGFTLSITNIIDCLSNAGYCEPGYLNKFLSLARDHLAAPQRPLTVFQSTNTRPPHGFHRYEMTSGTSVDQEIPKAEWDHSERMRQPPLER